MGDAEGASRNTFAAAPLDRIGTERENPHWLSAALRDPHTRILPMHGSRHLASDEERPHALWLPPGELAERLLHAADVTLLLGRARDPARPVTWLAAALPDAESGTARQLAEALAPSAWRELRAIGELLDQDSAALCCHARALVLWHRRTGFCSDCGGSTEIRAAGHQRCCTALACGAVHFPRTDAAVIVLVSHGDGDEERCLLGRQRGWPPGRYSALAGFLEAGEPLEACVRREVMEEAGVAVHDIRYHSSQPWPFPASLMLGFTARAQGTAIALHDDELEDARWFSRDQLAAALREGEVRVPTRISIAYRLLEDWYTRDGRSLTALLESAPW